MEPLKQSKVAFIELIYQSIIISFKLSYILPLYNKYLSPNNNQIVKKKSRNNI